MWSASLLVIHVGPKKDFEMVEDSVDPEECVGSLAAVGPDQVVLRRGGSAVSVRVKRRLWELHVKKCHQ